MKRYDDTVDRGPLKETGRYGRDGRHLTGNARRATQCAYGHAAHSLAVEDGLLSEEVDEILAGRRMVVAFPVGWREDPQEYAVRAVAEMMVAYLAFEPASTKADVRPLPPGGGRIIRVAVGTVRA